MPFSERMGLVTSKQIQVDGMDDSLRHRLTNRIERLYSDAQAAYVLDEMGHRVSRSREDYIMVMNPRKKNLDMLISLVERENWYKVYDAIEYGYGFLCLDCVGCSDYKNCDRVYDEEEDVYYECSYLEPKQTYIREFNSILEQEKAGYRLVDGVITPIIDKPELESVEEAIGAKFQTVSIHIRKALLLYSDREKPDYENSIKESISAVEAMCCIITELSGPSATLGAALKRLEDSGVVIHGAMREAFAKLYGYTSDSGGIRHGGIDFANASEEDAKYMLVSCSAFVNYLIEKHGKADGTM